MGKKIRVLVVDDSLLIRTLLQKELNKDSQIEVVATAADPVEAKKLIVQHKPDVITLDVQMPKMDGITFLGILNKSYPVPVVMLSTLTAEGSRLAIEALQRGATEIMQKPGGGSFLALGRVMEELTFKIKAAARAKRPALPRVQAAGAVPANAPKRIAPGLLIALGASTGGTEALRYVFSRLPAAMPPIVIVQHMPESFTEAFANSLDKVSPINVVEGNRIIELRPGLAVLARGGIHLTVSKKVTGYVAVPTQGELVCHQRPSVDVLFHSVAQAVGPKAVGAIFTGMGSDGADGLLAMRNSGAVTIAQDENSCVVFGMPKEAIRRGAAQHVLSLERIPQALVTAVEARADADRTLRVGVCM